MVHRKDLFDEKLTLTQAQELLSQAEAFFADWESDFFEAMILMQQWSLRQETPGCEHLDSIQLSLSENDGEKLLGFFNGFEIMRIYIEKWQEGSLFEETLQSDSSSSYSLSAHSAPY